MYIYITEYQIEGKGCSSFKLEIDKMNDLYRT